MEQYDKQQDNNKDDVRDSSDIHKLINSTTNTEDTI